MNNNINYELEVSMSVKAYTHKPNSTDYKCMRFKKEHMSLQEFIDKIMQGHSFCHIYKDNIRRKDRKSVV